MVQNSVVTGQIAFELGAACRANRLNGIADLTRIFAPNHMSGTVWCQAGPPKAEAGHPVACHRRALEARSTGGAGTSGVTPQWLRVKPDWTCDEYHNRR